jgi:putative ABC transport system permease protein
MRPEPPAHYRESLVERLGLKRFLSQPARMIVRNLERRPWKAFFTATGIAFSYTVLMMGMFSRDSIDYMVDIQFRLAKRDDLTVVFVEPTSSRAIHELESLRGVDYAEPFRSVPVRLRFEHRTYRTTIEGLPPETRLRRLLNTDLEPVALPLQGILLTDYLANEILRVQPGDLLTVEVLDGARPIQQVPVAGLIKEYLGISGYMRIDNLNRLLREGHAISGAYLSADAALQPEVYRRLKRTPRVAATTVREKAIRSLYDTMGETMLTFAFITTLLAATIAFGVVYNSARISLSERNWELASLRVLGFTRGEVSFILLGELALLTLLATPLGYVLGYAMCAAFVQGFQTDLFRIPLVLEMRTYTIATITVTVCSVISALVVRRRLDGLDMVGVLKSRE